MTDPSVSRETATPPAPAEARGVFADRLPLAERYAGLLATDGVVRGLIGPREAPRLWERHLLNCAVLEEVIAPDASVCDIGSGAGLPGIVLAIARPDLRVTLVEPLLRRTTFLEEVVEALGLTHVRVIRGRADALHGKEQFDVITSRAVAALPKLVEWSMPLVAPHGEMIALKGGSAEAEVTEAADDLARLGCAPARVAEVGSDRVPEGTWVVRIAWSDPSSVSFGPRAPRGASRSGSSRRKNRRPHGK